MNTPQAMSRTTTPPATRRNWRGESPDERQQQRRERFMDAALEAFARQGIAKTTMRDICSEARLTERYFYESFRNTDHAFDEVHGRLRQQLVARVGEALAQAPMDIESLARHGLRAFYLFIQEDPRRARVMLLDAIGANRHTFERSRDLVKEYVTMMDGLAVSLFPPGSRPVDVEFVAWGLVGLAVQVGTAWAASGMEKPVDEVLAYNLYAWRGLQHWIDAGAAAKNGGTQV